MRKTGNGSLPQTVMGMLLSVLESLVIPQIKEHLEKVLRLNFFSLSMR